MMSVKKERRDAVENHCIIMQIAKVLFMKHGVDEVSMHQIAKSAGIGQGTLYRRYAHKGELCLDLIVDSCRTINEKINRYLQEHKELPVHDRLESVLQFMLDYTEEQSHLLGAIHKPKCEGGRSIFYRSPFYESRHSIICNLLKAAILQQKNLNPLDPVFVADAILASIAPDLYLFFRRDRGYTNEDIRTRLQSLYLDPLFS
ncbi:MAG TPA: TetR/AcrR family transcriptional regulator [Bacilli bacterium]